ncbi:hypothetical protein FGB62_93g036 [Gracilaria domingensis]|nr:hypothetical protein FGB62_93g036 [Gracilaria domingensis]
MLAVSASVIEDIQNINCSSYNPEQRLLDAKDRGNCLSALFDSRYRQKFDKCKENVCFLFINEPPFVMYEKKYFYIEKNLKQMQLPFLCKNRKQKHRSLGGIAFNILKETSAGDEFCAWAGPVESCTWNAIVDFVAVMGNKEGYQFAVLGPMLETPQRKCSHFASSSWWDGRMVVMGRNAQKNRASVHPLWQLINPFQKETWIVVGSMVALFAIICLMIVYRFHLFWGKSLTTAVTAYFVIMGERAEALAAERIENISDGGEGFSGRFSKAEQEGSREVSLRGTFSSADSSLRRDDNDSRIDAGNDTERAFLTKSSLAISLFRISLIAFVALFSLFYEVAVVNFIFQQQNLQITKDIEHLTLMDLGRYAVVRDTAVEAVWNFRGKEGDFFKNLSSVAQQQHIFRSNFYLYHLIRETNTCSESTG